MTKSLGVLFAGLGLVALASSPALAEPLSIDGSGCGGYSTQSVDSGQSAEDTVTAQLEETATPAPQSTPVESN